MEVNKRDNNNQKPFLEKRACESQKSDFDKGRPNLSYRIQEEIFSAVKVLLEISNHSTYGCHGLQMRTEAVLEEF